MPLKGPYTSMCPMSQQLGFKWAVVDWCTWVTGANQRDESGETWK